METNNIAKQLVIEKLNLNKSSKYHSNNKKNLSILSDQEVKLNHNTFVQQSITMSQIQPNLILLCSVNNLDNLPSITRILINISKTSNKHTHLNNLR
jgi:hypothetical protein